MACKVLLCCLSWLWPIHPLPQWLQTEAQWGGEWAACWFGLLPHLHPHLHSHSTHSQVQEPPGLSIFHSGWVGGHLGPIIIMCTSFPRLYFKLGNRISYGSIAAQIRGAAFPTFFCNKKKERNCIRGSFLNVPLILKTLTFKSGTSIRKSYRTTCT